MVPAVGRAGRRLVFAGLKCARPHTDEPEIPLAFEMVVEAAAGFAGFDANVLHPPRRPSRSRIRLPRLPWRGLVPADLQDAEAGTADLAAALACADVVHVVAHGSPAGIALAKETFTAASVRDLPVRCSLLVLGSCETAALAEDPNAFVLPLVERGVNILAPGVKVGDKFVRRFLREFYDAFLPGREAEGPTFADAVRVAAAKCRASYERSEQRDDPVGPWRHTINGFILFGDPTLRLRSVPGGRRCATAGGGASGGRPRPPSADDAAVGAAGG